MIAPVESDGVAPSSTDVCVARQPILAANLSVYAYELLYRKRCDQDFAAPAPETEATSYVLSTSFLEIGMTRLVGTRKAFINFDRAMLVSDIPAMLPPDRVVIEVLEDIRPDAEVVSRCKDLKSRGFELALDDFSAGDGLQELIALASYIKVDFRLTTPEAQRGFPAMYGRGARLLAEKVETWDDFARARDAGYVYFQGYFFARPVVLTGTTVSPLKTSSLRLLAEISKQDLDYSAIESVLQREPPLTYRLLRYMNSAAFSWSARIRSVGHALALLGDGEIRRWGALVALSGFFRDAPSELMVACTIRARFGELLAGITGLEDRGSEIFLMGMLSAFDAVLQRPLESILKEVGLSPDLCEPLLQPEGRNSKVALIYHLVRAYEAADWGEVAAVCRELKLPQSLADQNYQEGVHWAETVMQGQPGR
jgi:c-di-GMP-related signal transduction protein